MDSSICQFFKNGYIHSSFCQFFMGLFIFQYCLDKVILNKVKNGPFHCTTFKKNFTIETFLLNATWIIYCYLFFFFLNFNWSYQSSSSGLRVLREKCVSEVCVLYFVYVLYYNKKEIQIFFSNYPLVFLNSLSVQCE